MKKAILFLTVFLALAVCAGEKLPKYIILFIGDGMATPQRMMAEEFARKTGHGKLIINHFPCHATTRTASASSLVTDSAAAGTAIACGSKTSNGRIGLAADGKTRLESVAELAKKKNYKVGIVSTVTINHATPASFYGHRASRSQYYELGLDLVESNFDYFAGGGVAFPTGKPKKKGDPAPQLPSIYDLAAKTGYKVLKDKKAFLALKPGSGKILYSASKGNITPSIDADADDTSLAELTAKGLELLKNEKGFFFMVEGGTIDSYGHANEAALLASCYHACLELAAHHQLKSVDFPSISTGVYGYPLKQAAKVALQAISEHLASHQLPEQVRMVCHTESAASIYRQVWASMAAK
jgi:alkaline phosphatase